MSYDRYYSNEKVQFQRRLTLRNINLLNKFYTDKHQAYLIHYAKQECQRAEHSCVKKHPHKVVFHGRFLRSLKILVIDKGRQNYIFKNAWQSNNAWCTGKDQNLLGESVNGSIQMFYILLILNYGKVQKKEKIIEKRKSLRNIWGALIKQRCIEDPIKYL